MASHGAAKTRAVPMAAPKGGEGEGTKAAGEVGVKFHAIHSKIAEHLAGLETHLAGLHQAHAMLGEHLGLNLPGKSRDGER